MREVIYRYQWDLPRRHDCEFQVYSHGLNEEMPAGMEYQSIGEDDWLIIYFNDAVRVDFGDGMRDLPSGSLVIWRPGESHIYGHPERAWRHSWIHVSGTGVEPMLDLAGFAPHEPLRISQPMLVENYFLQIFNEISSHSEPDNRILRNLFESWLLEMARVSRGGEENMPSESLKRLKRYLDEHISEKLSLADMSRIAGMSVSHLSSEFNRCFGESPGRYIISRRMKLACYLLRERTLRISQVADELGYPDIYQFSRMFKRVVGISPKRYRETGVSFSIFGN